MSQFMLCKSKYDLKKLNCTKLLNYKINNELLTKVANEYVPVEEQKNLWVLQEINYMISVQISFYGMQVII